MSTEANIDPILKEQLILFRDAAAELHVVRHELELDGVDHSQDPRMLAALGRISGIVEQTPEIARAYMTAAWASGPAQREAIKQVQTLEVGIAAVLPDDIFGDERRTDRMMSLRTKREVKRVASGFVNLLEPILPPPPSSWKRTADRVVGPVRMATTKKATKSSSRRGRQGVASVQIADPQLQDVDIEPYEPTAERPVIVAPLQMEEPLEIPDKATLAEKKVLFAHNIVAGIQRLEAPEGGALASYIDAQLQKHLKIDYAEALKLRAALKDSGNLHYLDEDKTLITTYPEQPTDIAQAS